jgi:hypothetical protein
MISFVLAGLLLGSDEALKVKKEVVMPEGTPTVTLTPMAVQWLSLVFLDGSTVTVTPESGFASRFHRVKNKEGWQIKFEESGVTIEAPSLRVKSGGNIFLFRIDEKGVIRGHRLNVGESE